MWWNLDFFRYHIGCRAALATLGHSVIMADREQTGIDEP